MARKAQTNDASIDNTDDRPKKAYTIGAVGPKGQVFGDVLYQAGDTLELAEEDAEQHRSNGVPLHDAEPGSPLSQGTTLSKRDEAG
jgi:hypothetical protein